jgi:hypothetical protein
MFFLLSKQSVSNDRWLGVQAHRCSRVLAVEGCNRCGGFGRAGVLLEVDQAAGEDEHVTSFQGGREECV